jgi:hypothetical protein
MIGTELVGYGFMGGAFIMLSWFLVDTIARAERERAQRGGAFGKPRATRKAPRGRR